ncbi:MAG: AI-2E family transporter, partial [Cyanobacteriota bacterium]|nr:AI-2E family transporter [Cyanobacteriota bacterium]
MLGPLVFPIWLRLSLVLPLFALNLWVLRQLLVPLAPFPGLFVTAALIAFLLDIPSRWINQRLGLPRWLAIGVVAVLAVGLLVLAGVALVPRLIDQLGQLINELPGWLVAAEGWVSRLQEWASGRGLPSEFGDFSSDLLTRL